MRILFVTSNRIGDTVLSTGLIGALLERHADARITLACGPAAAGLFAAMPRLDRLVVMPKRRFAAHWLRLWLAAVGTAWDLVIDLRSSGLAWLLRAGDRRVFGRGEPTPGHRVEQLGRLLDIMPPPSPVLWTTEVHRRRAAELMPGEPWLALGPTANWGGKQWPAERFAELGGRLTAPGAPLAGARIAVFGGVGEQAAAAPLLASLPALDLVGRIDLLTVHACLARAGLYVGNDSGLMHIAAAAGTPTLGLFGPSREEHYAPWGPRTGTVRTDLSYEQILASPGYDYRSPASRMDSLGVDKVERAALTLIERVTQAA
jgi:heptosyltransferase-3